MLSFLAPMALAGAALLAIPIAIHLFKPRRVRVTPFSSLRWLNLSKQKLARRVQWHQLLLFFVRAAFVLLLVLALARPLLTPGGAPAGVDRFIVLDASRSMGYTQAGQPSPLDRAKAVAAQLLTHGQADDRVTLLVTTDQSRAMGELAGDGQPYANRLTTLAPTQGRTDLSSALDAIWPMLSRIDATRSAQLYFLTDNPQQAWNQGVIRDFTARSQVPLNVQVVDVSTPGGSNAFIMQVEHVTRRDEQRQANALRVTVGYTGLEKTSRRVMLDALPGQPPQQQAIDLEPGQHRVVELPLPADLPAASAGPSPVAHVWLDPADGLASDDQAWLALAPDTVTQVLLVDHASSDEARQRQGLHLAAALRALGVSSQGRLAVTRKPVAQLTQDDIQRAQVVLLANVPSLTLPQLEALRDRVAGGAGLGFFLGPQVDVSHYNSVLRSAATPRKNLLPVTLGALRRSSAGAGQLPTLTDAQWSSPLLDTLFDPVLGDLPQTRFFAHFDLQVDVAQDPSALVLARIDGRSPAIVQSQYGAGQVVVLNTTADDAWSDLPRRRSFVPLVDRLITHLGGPAIQRRFEVLTPVSLLLPESAGQAGQGSWRIVGPSGQALAPAVSTVGSRAMLRLDGVAEPGVYEVRDAAGKAVTRFIACVSLDDSRLISQDTQMLSRWWEPVPLSITTPDDALAQFSQAVASTRLWPWLVALGAAMLALEMFLVHRLCPRMNPALVDSVVHRQGGILAPGASVRPGDASEPAT